jgi:hypothetical protein
VPVPVERPYPIHIPVYKHVFYRKMKKQAWEGFQDGKSRFRSKWSFEALRVARENSEEN